MAVQRVATTEERRWIDLARRAIPGMTAAEQQLLMNYVLDPAATYDGFVATYRGFASFKARYAAFEDMYARDPSFSEANYRELERSYRQVMDSYGLPDRYKDPSSLANLMRGDVSVDEVDARLQQANQLLRDAPAEYKSALRDLYGITDGDALAFLVDPKGAKPILDRKADERMRATTLATRARQYGLDLSVDEVRDLAGSTASTFDSYSAVANTGQYGAAVNDATINRAMQSAAVTAREDALLAGVDGESYDSYDAVQAAFGNQEKSLASQQRRAREKARFSGSSGVGSGSLSQARNL